MQLTSHLKLVFYTKNLDILEDAHLKHFLKYGTYLPGASNKQN